MPFRINCCNCLFDMYLLEINQNPQLLEVNYENQIKILRLREKRSMDNDLHKHWLNFNGNITFCACFSCVYKVLHNSAFRKHKFVLENIRERMS